uniref:Fucolectin tachylectin-4 pentraxin-1 domain-containing protein n=1 Tax=Monopterus albus TaxID=43700 RepID=A0A3Q3Q8R4_MONAL
MLSCTSSFHHHVSLSSFHLPDDTPSTFLPVSLITSAVVSQCAVISTMQPWTTKSFQCDGMKGRYVNIVIPGRQEYLTVCEVEVIGRPPAVNIALGKKVTQSSVYLGGVPERAIDGNYASNLEEKSCSQTQKELNPWWRLDLLKPYKIMTVSITNRGDCCAERLSEAEI